MKEEPRESFPPRRDGATRGMRADGESREQQQQWRRWRGRRRRRRSRRSGAPREEPAALPEEAAAVGRLPRRRQHVPRQEAGVFLTDAVPLQGGLHQQRHLPHVRLQGGWSWPLGARVRVPGVLTLSSYRKFLEPNWTQSGLVFVSDLW